MIENEEKCTLHIDWPEPLLAALSETLVAGMEIDGKRSELRW
jgi:hypothetical protein